MKDTSFKTKRSGSIPILIACLFLLLMGVGSLFAAAAMAGDRTGVGATLGSGGSTGGTGGTDEGLVSSDPLTPPSAGGCINVPYIQQGGNDHGRVGQWCGRASQAMVISYFNPENSWYKTFNFQDSHGLSASTVRNLSGKPYVAITTTPKSRPSNPDMDAVINSINKGYPVIAYTRGLTSANHIFVLTGYDAASQTFKANDTYGGPSRACITKIGGKTITKSNLASHLYAQESGTYFILVR